jgi:sulfopyruvate decarboxylase subunit alpha
MRLDEKGRKLNNLVCTSEIFANELRKYCNYFTGVPDSVFKGTQIYLPNYKFSSRENHAIGLAFGSLLGNKKPCLLIQNSGLGLAIDSLLGLFKLYKKGVLIVVSNRGELEWEEIQHQDWGDVTLSLINTLGFKIIDLEENGISSIKIAAECAFQKNEITVLLVHRGNLDE